MLLTGLAIGIASVLVATYAGSTAAKLGGAISLFGAAFMILVAVTQVVKS